MTQQYILKKGLCVITLLSGSFTFAQVGIGTTNPDPDSILDLSSPNKGLLLTRVPLSSPSSSTPLGSNVPGMVVYNTTSGLGLVPGIYFNDASSWLKVATVNIGDIKYSFNPADHNGWYLLNGRALTSLPANAQSNAIAMGFLGNLPNATDRFLKANDGTETLGNTGGSATIVVGQTNLPNVNFTGTTNSTGEHTHSYTDQGDTTIINLGLVGLANGADNTSGSYTTGSAGNHSHTVTVASGGSNTPITNEPAHIVTNIFVYLGT
ncbi:MAG: hypothetical protein V4670_10910 [Bacteroidota bacterium]